MQNFSDHELAIKYKKGQTKCKSETEWDSEHGEMRSKSRLIVYRRLRSCFKDSCQYRSIKKSITDSYAQSLRMTMQKCTTFHHSTIGLIASFMFTLSWNQFMFSLCLKSQNGAEPVDFFHTKKPTSYSWLYLDILSFTLKCPYRWRFRIVQDEHNITFQSAH